MYSSLVRSLQTAGGSAQPSLECVPEARGYERGDAQAEKALDGVDC